MVGPAIAGAAYHARQRRVSALGMRAPGTRLDAALWRWWGDGADAVARRIGRAATSLVPGARIPSALTLR